MNKIRQARQQSGLKVNKIANMLGIARSHYYNLESGYTKITDDRAEQLSKILNLDKNLLIRELAKEEK